MSSIVLVDCNNFFVSCERLFQPMLENRPVVVLSSNDGCIVSRSQEVKDLGIPMGSPYFKVKDCLEKHRVRVFSSNFQLYGDISKRTMIFLNKFAVKQEIYSVDECFLEFTDSFLKDEGFNLKQLTKQCLGIPVSVGIGETKTQSKLASYFAKKIPSFNGVCSIKELPDSIFQILCKGTKVNEVWGVGRRLSEKLNSHKIYTVEDLKNFNPEIIRSLYGLPLAQTVMELNGTRCFKFSDKDPPRQTIISSRSFGTPVTEIVNLEKAISSHVTKASEKLRQDKSIAGGIIVNIRTNKFSNRDAQYKNSIFVSTTVPTDDPSILIKAALNGLEKIFVSGFRYSKSGVMLCDIKSKKEIALPCFYEDSKNAKTRDNLIAEVDRLNKVFGSNTISWGASGTKKVEENWAAKNMLRSFLFTSKWEDIPVVR